MGNFTRTFRLIEKLFPGNQEIPGSVGTHVQPVWDATALKLGEALLGHQIANLELVPATPGWILLLGPVTGRAQIPASITVFGAQTAPGDSCTMVMAREPVEPDAWGAWQNAGIETRGFSGGPYTRFPGQIIIVHGNQLQFNFSVAAGGAIQVSFMYWDVPAELVPLTAG